MSVLTDHTVLPPGSAEGEELHALTDIFSRVTELFLVTADGRKFKLGGELRNVLAHASKALSEGHAVTLEPRRAVLINPRSS